MTTIGQATCATENFLGDLCVLAEGHQGPHAWDADLPTQAPDANLPRLQLIVTYFDHAIMYYPTDAGQGWKIDSASRCLVVGRGVPRTMIPLDQVRSFDIAPMENSGAGHPPA